MKVVVLNYEYSTDSRYKTVGNVSSVKEFYEKYMKKGRIESTIEEWIEWHNNAFGEDIDHLISRHSSVLGEITVLINK